MLDFVNFFEIIILLFKHIFSFFDLVFIDIFYHQYHGIYFLHFFKILNAVHSVILFSLFFITFDHAVLKNASYKIY